MKILAACMAMYMLTVFGAIAQVPKLVKTSGKLPQLAYSDGEDRLGSAKMGYIDTGIVLAVVDSTKGLYKVKLSALHTAYLDQRLAIPLPDSTPAPRIVTCESWTVRRLTDQPADLVAINLGRKVPYKTWMELEPARIVVQLFRVQANTNWITQLTSANEVKRVDYRQTEDDVVEATVYLHHKQPYGYHVAYQGNQLQLSVRHHPASHSLRGKTIVVDAGHGGSNTGARGNTSGIIEKKYTLLFAKAFQKELKRKKARVVMVRESDTTFDNKDRILFARGYNPDAFISFHLNSSSRTTARGTSTYYKHAAFRLLTTNILGRLLDINNLQEFGNIGSFNFQPVQPTEYNSCLVEVAFVSNEADEKMIQDAGFRKQVARQVRRGLTDWLRHLN